MCTLTWLATADGYELFFNRDESRERPRADEPTWAEAEGGVAYLAPTDPAAGGTWIAVNELGVSVALLNAYGGGSVEVAGRRPSRSRGGLVRALAGAPSASAVVAELASVGLHEYPAFTLAAFGLGADDGSDPPAFIDRSLGRRADGRVDRSRDGGGETRLDGRSVLVRVWDGEHLKPRVVGDLPILTSSSFEQNRVVGARRAALETILDSGPATPARLLEFQRLHLREGRSWSPCVHRDASVTASLSWIRVTRDHAEFDYADGSPCASRPFVSTRIPRARDLSRVRLAREA